MLQDSDADDEAENESEKVEAETEADEVGFFVMIIRELLRLLLLSVLQT